MNKKEIELLCKMDNPPFDWVIEEIFKSIPDWTKVKKNAKDN